MICLHNKSDEEDPEQVSDETSDEDRSKVENLEIYLDKILEDATPKSILIFSEYEKSLIDVENMLHQKNLTFAHLKGQSKYIDNTVKLYKENKIDILLLNSKYFGSGINLENTTHLFMFHRMKNHIDKQVIGRAQRPGRTTPLQLYRLCYPNELL